MIDIRIDNEEGHFKFRVAGVLKYKDKYLFVKMNQNNFYCLPGGHVELGEDTDKAVLREMQEELGFSVKISRFLGEAQNFYIRKDETVWHELGYYYEVVAENEADINKDDHVRLENDKGFIQHLEFKWLTIEELEQVDFRPSFVLEMLKNENSKHIIFNNLK